MLPRNVAPPARANASFAPTGRHAVLLLLVLVVMSAPHASARTTLIVDNDFADCPNADFNTIQAAVAAAQPGDKILVCPGIYNGTVLIATPAKDNLRVQARGAPNEVVLQGTPADFAGFYLQGVSGVLVHGFTVQGFHEANIRVEGGARNTIRDNVTTLSTHHDGIQVADSAENVIEHNTSFANPDPVGCGINVIGPASVNNIVRHNRTFDNVFGIQVVAGTGNVVFRNDSYANRMVGIRSIVGANGTTIQNNNVFENLGQGIVVAGSTDVTVKNNRTENNVLNGVRLLNASGGVVERNDANNNGLSGIALENADANAIRLNRSEKNGQDGIRANPLSAGNTIAQNLLRGNLEHDAHDDSVGPGTAGTANIWIKNHCETENRPGLCAHRFQD